MFRTTNYIYCKISPILSLLYSLLVVLYRRRKLIYYIRQNGFTFPNYWAIDSPMFNYHSLIPWGSFRGRQEEKWGSFRGRDHFGVCTVINRKNLSSGKLTSYSKKIPKFLCMEDFVTPKEKSVTQVKSILTAWKN